MSRYELRVLLWSWGLMVDLGLAAHVSRAAPQLAIPVAPRVWLVVVKSKGVGDPELTHLLNGLRRVAPRVAADLAANSEHLVFVLDHLWFPFTDSQDDALELAVVGWAVEELGIETEPAEVSFDRSANCYKIKYNEEIWRVEG